MSTLPGIFVLNTLPIEEFNKVVNVLFETAPPLSSTLQKNKPFESYKQLIDVAAHCIASMSEEEKIEVINAHPRIGTNPAKEKLSAFSYKEQGLKAEETAKGEEIKEIERVYAKLRELNAIYEEKFGFKFVVYVAGRPKSVIVKVLDERLSNPREKELNTGLTAMIDIARDRLSKMIVEKNKL